MRDLKKNLVSIGYQLLSVTASDDEWGNTTNVKDYGDKLTAKVSISAGTGSTDADVFGSNVTYDRSISTIKDYGFDVNTHLFVDNTSTYDYKIIAVAKSLNEYRYAIKRIAGAVNES